MSGLNQNLKGEKKRMNEKGIITQDQKQVQETLQPDKAKVNKWIYLQAKEIERLLKEGKTTEEALLLTAHMIPRTQVIGDRIEYIKNLQSIAAVRKALHGAQAKLSKSLGKPEQETRYREEIAVAKAKLNELLAIVNADPDPLNRALEMGEDPSGLVQRVIEDEEKEINSQLEKVKVAMKWTKKQLKNQINSCSSQIPEQIFDKLSNVSSMVLGIYENRANGGDQRVITLNKKIQLLNKMTELAKKKREEAKAQEELAQAKEKGHQNQPKQGNQAKEKGHQNQPKQGNQGHLAAKEK
jgi:hypothetical protein